MRNQYFQNACKRIKESIRAKHLKRSLGTRTAAGYLRNRGWSLEAALFILA